MIVKDQRVLFPICAVNFTEDEWKGIYLDSKAYGWLKSSAPIRIIK